MPSPHDSFEKYILFAINPRTAKDVDPKLALRLAFASLDGKSVTRDQLQDFLDADVGSKVLLRVSIDGEKLCEIKVTP